MRSFIGVSSRVGPAPVITGGVLLQPPVDLSAIEVLDRQPAHEFANLLLVVIDSADVKNLLQPLGDGEHRARWSSAIVLSLRMSRRRQISGLIPRSTTLS